MSDLPDPSPFWQDTPRWGRDEDGNGPRRPRDPFRVRVMVLALVTALVLPLVAVLNRGAGDAGAAPGGDAVALSTGADGSIELIDPTATSPVAPSVVQAAGQEAPANPAAASDSLPAVASTAPHTTAAPTTSSAAPTAAERSGGSSEGSSERTAGAADDTPAPTTAAPTAIPQVVPTAEVATEAAATPAPTTSVVPCADTYEVAEGDYWIGIADRAGVSTGELLAANGASADTPIYPGGEICLPEGAKQPGTPPVPTTDAPAPTTTAAPTTTEPAKPTTTTTKPPATTEQPTTTAPPATTLPAKKYTRDEVIAIIASVFPEDQLATALKIAERESNFVPTAKNWCCYGLFQIHWGAHQGWLDDLGITAPELLFDPLVNAQAAYALYQRAGGWGPWGGVPG